MTTINLQKLVDEASEQSEVYLEIQNYFDDFNQYLDFLKMQLKYYPQGIKFENFLDNVQTFALGNLISSINSKLGSEVIKMETDDGTEFYKLK